MKSLVAHAGQSYISEKDMEKMMNVIDVSNWSPRMREPMEAIYGKVLEPRNIYFYMLCLMVIYLRKMIYIQIKYKQTYFLGLFSHFVEGIHRSFKRNI